MQVQPACIRAALSAKSRPLATPLLPRVLASTFQFGFGLEGSHALAQRCKFSLPVSVLLCRRSHGPWRHPSSRASLQARSSSASASKVATRSRKDASSACLYPCCFVGEVTALGDTPPPARPCKHVPVRLRPRR